MADSAMLQQRIFSGSVESRLDFALTLFRQFGPSLRQLEAVSALLARMELESRDLADHMRALALGRLCAHCAATDGGGCCSSYMAGETDSLQILMNLLTGTAVERVNHTPEECCYLGETGCLFQFKPMFCLNYNCHRIQAHAAGSGLRQLEQLAARLLGSQYQLEAYLFACLSRWLPREQRTLL